MVKRAAAMMWMAAVGLGLGAEAMAQGRSPLEIRDIRLDDKLSSPEYEVNRITTQPGRKKWFEATVFYETEPEWIDELEFSYYFLVKTENREEPFIVFSGTVTYIDVPEGRHMATAYLHPHTVLRYGEVERVGVEVKFRGRLVARRSEPEAGGQAWWERLPPRAGYVLNRKQTPFAFINVDDYEAIKTETAR
jgi:hypothetical protein